MERWRVHILIDKAEHGDGAAIDDLIRLAAEGDLDARTAIVRGVTGSEPSREPKDEGKAAKKSSCSALVPYTERLRELVKLVDRNPKAAEPVILEELHRPVSNCFRVQILGMLAQILKGQGLYHEAEGVLDYAESVGCRCRDSVADLWRRRAILHANQRRFPEGFELITKALNYYRSAVDAGHDLDGNGIASCRFVRADLKFNSGDKEGAAEDYTACLAALGPTQAPDLFDLAISNLAIVFSRMDREHQEKSLSMLSDVRRRFQGHTGPSVPRARLDWWESMVRLALRKGRRDRALEKLLDAQMAFIAQGMRNEAMAVTADIVRALWEEIPRLQSVLGRSLGPLRGIVKSARLAAHIDALEVSACSKDVFLAKLDEATTRLRGAAKGTGVFPCLLV